MFVLKKCMKNSALYVIQNVFDLYETVNLSVNSNDTLSLDFIDEAMLFILTHISLASLLRDIGKHHIPRCYATERSVPSEAILFAQRKFIEK